MSASTAFGELFAPEDATAPPGTAAWTVLLVDDEPDIHTVLHLALQDMVVDGRRLQLLDAHGSEEARRVLAAHPETALVLLDVVMETDHAGLDLVRHIRQDLGNRQAQIILVTGQPGYAPEREVVASLDINGYCLKSELSSARIFVSAITALRAHQRLLALEQQRAQLAEYGNHLEQLVQARTAALEGSNLHLERSNRALEDLNAQLKQAQAQLLQSEKMASIGQLAAGIAHEINNPVGYVKSNLNALQKYVADFETLLDAYGVAETRQAEGAAAFAEVHRIAREIDIGYERSDIDALLAESVAGLERVAKIVLDLKNFARAEHDAEWAEEDLHKGLESTLNVIWNQIKYHCEVKRAYGELPPVPCVLPQLNQVFMNLLINAAQSITGQGCITIATGSAGDEAWVEIADTGRGIAHEHLPRIFDPFFTTKAVGSGTGLGLSISYNIVRKHHGRIEVDSAPGQGSRFRIWLPLRQPKDARAPGDPR
ncbi:putative Histidine kinase [Rubrivivax sp. A210]|uniref:ATP-binding protein n=1 Tax=Rubrivivax sp. A210 TaxID=2772301 RepID=UPI00198D1D66|nr:ATP-binding protein [Rubrivivax sp. A210]CAD5369270.1 putative Histidine kinase [Rubrivivax sp. A210]